MTATDLYALGRDPAESARLQRQSKELLADSAALLSRVGLAPGQAAIDVGCGPSGIIELLAERVSPGGRVVGLDADPAHVALARELARRDGLGNVTIVAADARRTGLPPGSFDLVHARTLLVTVPQPAEVLAEMVRLARPGGWIASLEPDTEYSLCYPAHPAWTRLSEIFRTVPLTWCAACAPSFSGSGWPTSRSWTTWTARSASISTTPARSSCPT
jgi:ubiquinone/menaquinone biosynthesis C-methylase UbiE